MDKALYAGVDAGGTSTRCLVADGHGDIRGLGQAGPGNALIEGRARALDAIRRALRQALGNHPDRRVAHLHLAAAGTLVPDGLAELADSWSSSNDAPAALAGAMGDGPGLIVIAGTGSVCYGRAVDGWELLLGGWGPLAGDEGSAYAIGRAALQQLASALDRRQPHSLLSTAVLAHLEAHDRPTLLTRLYDPPLLRDEVAALAGQVAWAAERGDTAARRLLARAGDDLARSVAALAGHLDLHGETARVATLGGVFGSGSLVLIPFKQRLHDLVPGAQVVPARFPPVTGSLLLAYRHAGVPVDARLLARLDAGIARLGLS